MSCDGDQLFDLNTPKQPRGSVTREILEEERICEFRPGPSGSLPRGGCVARLVLSSVAAVTLPPRSGRRKGCHVTIRSFNHKKCTSKL